MVVNTGGPKRPPVPPKICHHPAVGPLSTVAPGAARAAWLARLLKEYLLGTLPEDLQAASRMSTSPEFLAAANAVENVCRTVRNLG